RPVPSKPAGGDGSQAGRDKALQHRARDRHAANGKQFIDVELQADAKHEEDDSNLRKLLSEVNIRGIAGRVGSDDDTGKEIANDGGKAEALREISADEGRAQSSGEREYESG